MHAITAPGRKRGFLIAAGALALATGVRWLLGPWLGQELPLITYYIAVLAVAWVATVGPALAALVAGAALAQLLFAGPGGDIHDFLRYFVVGGAAVVAMRSALSSAIRQRALLAGTINTALDCIITIDRDDRIREFNAAAERTFGHKREDVLGRDLAELLIPERYRSRHRAALRRYLDTGEATILDRRVEITALRADGSEFPVELAVTRVSVVPPVFTAYLRDLTEKRRAEALLAESEQRFRDLIGRLEDYAIFFTDVEGRATSWNEGVRRILGYEESEFIGMDVAAIFTPEDVALGVPRGEFEKAAREGAASNDRWMRRKDGSRFFALGVTVARHDAGGRLVGYAKIMRDRTDIKELETRLSETVERLAHINERQSQFLATLSHELRNPLAPIRTAVEVLKLTGGSAAGDGQAIGILSRQVEQLVRLVDDLLDLNRIRTGKIELQRERVDLREAISHSIEVAQAQCSHFRHRLEVRKPPEPLIVDADSARIGQVVSNLLHNACKFTPPGGEITLALEHSGDDAVIRVSDTGIGIPPDQLDRIFGMFEQVEPATGSPSGLGIGLSLAKSLVELHGGRIEARSAGRGRGAEFVVRLPLARAQPLAEREPAPAKPHATPGRRVLVVDDNRDAAHTLGMVLELHGHEVAYAHDGEEALDRAGVFRPEVVLLDIGLPKLDGYEVATRLRRDSALPRATLVAITGWGQAEDVRRAMEAGFDAHFTKPIEYAALLPLLEKRPPKLRIAS